MLKPFWFYAVIFLKLERIGAFSIKKNPSSFLAIRQSAVSLRYVPEDEQREAATSALDELAGAEIIDFVLTKHKPLGCTVEESLADPASQLVFVTKVVEGGCADQAGLEVGDVIVGVSGIFGDWTDTVGVGIEEV
jgi:predicted metalloprotease with PDZ domain